MSTTLWCQLRPKWPQCEQQPSATQLQRDGHVSYLCTNSNRTPSLSSVTSASTFYFARSFTFYYRG